MSSIVTDYTKCVACGRCIAACQQAHGLPGTLRYRFIRAELYSTGGGELFQFVVCRHCSEPSCIKACDNDVYFVSDSGAVLRREDNCQHCGQCLSACPYGAIQLDMQSSRIGKCDLCTGMALPACYRACPQQAIQIVRHGSLKLKGEI